MSLIVKYTSHLTLCPSFSILKMRIILFIHIPHSLLCYSTFLWILIPCVPGGSVVKNPSATSGDLSSNPDLGRSPGGGHGNPLHCFCLENPMDRGAQWAIYSPWGHKSDFVTSWQVFTYYFYYILSFHLYNNSNEFSRNWEFQIVENIQGLEMEMEFSGHQMSLRININNTAIKLTQAYLLSRKIPSFNSTPVIMDDSFATNLLKTQFRKC